MKFCFGIFVLFFFAGIEILEAQVVSVRFVENSEPNTEVRIPLTESVISGVMNGMFDSGLIATSDAVIRGEFPSVKNVKSCLESARGGMVDFVLALYADYRLSTFRSGLFYPVSFQYYILEVETGNILQQGTVQGLKDRDDLERESWGLSKELGLAIASATGKIIARGKGE